MEPSAGKNSHEVRISVLETQLSRIVSDIESEKRTRAEANSNLNLKVDRINDHMSKQDKMYYVGVGVLGALQFLVPLAAKYVFK